jgi:hypothetical protein
MNKIKLTFSDCWCVVQIKTFVERLKSEYLEKPQAQVHKATFHECMIFGIVFEKGRKHEDVFTKFE